MCNNPFLEIPCTKEDLAVFLMYKGIQKSICHSCWEKIGDGDQEWGNDPKPESITEILRKERKLEKNSTLTEYKSRG